MDAWCSPERIRQAHLPDEVPNFTRHFRPSRFTLPTLPGPIEAESPAMPGDDRFRLDDDERGTPAGPQLQQPCPQEAIERIESNAPADLPVRFGKRKGDGIRVDVQTNKSYLRHATNYIRMRLCAAGFFRSQRKPSHRDPGLVAQL